MCETLFASMIPHSTARGLRGKVQAAMQEQMDGIVDELAAAQNVPESGKALAFTTSYYSSQ